MSSARGGAIAKIGNDYLAVLSVVSRRSKARSGRNVARLRQSEVPLLSQTGRMSYAHLEMWKGQSFPVEPLVPVRDHPLSLHIGILNSPP